MLDVIPGTKEVLVHSLEPAHIIVGVRHEVDVQNFGICKTSRCLTKWYVLDT